MSVKMTIVKGLNNREVYSRLPDNTEDSTCSMRCGGSKISSVNGCGSRNWLYGSFSSYNNILIECHKCERIMVHPFLKRKDIEVEK